MLFMAKIRITLCSAFMDQMLDAGFCLPAIVSRSGEAGGDTGFLKVTILILSSIKHPGSRI